MVMSHGHPRCGEGLDRKQTSSRTPKQGAQSKGPGGTGLTTVLMTSLVILKWSSGRSKDFGTTQAWAQIPALTLTFSAINLLEPLVPPEQI